MDLELPGRGAVLTMIVLLCGCASPSSRIGTIDDPDDMRAALQAYVPRGTPVELARTYMENEGFSCQILRNEEFSERVTFADAGKKHPAIDFLECRKSQTFSLLMSRNWIVALVLDGDSVDHILVGHYIDGP